MMNLVLARTMCFNCFLGSCIMQAAAHFMCVLRKSEHIIAKSDRRREYNKRVKEVVEKSWIHDSSTEDAEAPSEQPAEETPAPNPAADAADAPASQPKGDAAAAAAADVTAEAAVANGC